MSGLTSEDLHRELQRFAEDTIRRQLFELATDIRNGIREDMQRIISSSQANPATDNLGPGQLPGQVVHMDIAAVAVTSCASLAQKQPMPPDSKVASDTHGSLESLDELEVDNGYAAAKEKLSLLRTAVASDPYIAEELRNIGYFNRCNASDALGKETKGGANTQETMLPITPREEDDDMDLTLATPGMASMRIEDVDERMSYSKIASVVCSDNFEYCVSFLICLNAIFLGVGTQVAASHHETCEYMFLRIVELLFFIIFLSELGMRIFVFRCWFVKFQTPSGTKNQLLFWNVFDTFMVFCQGCELILGLLDNCQGGVSFGNITALRLLRLLRIGRLLRVGKLLRLSESLRVIGTAVFNAGGIFLWSITSLLVITYVFAVYFTEVAMIHLKEATSDVQVKEHFGSLWSSWMSLLKAIAGGIDWGDLSTPLGRVGYFYALFPFLGFVFFTLIVLMNVFTGMFLESCSQKAKEEQEIQLLQNAYQTFKLSDYNNNNTIGKTEFQASLKHKSVSRFFDAIDLDIQQAEVLFELLDTSGDGQISCNDFLRGCLRLRGTSKALDLLVLSREVNQLIDGLATATKRNAAMSKWNHKQIDKYMRTSQDKFLAIHQLLEEVLKKLSS